MPQEPCPFCDIISGASKERIVEQGEHAFVVLSDPRLMPGHTLVIPKRHIEKPWEMTSDERKEVFDTLLRLQERIIEQYASGCDVRQHYRPFLQQSWVKVNHVHYHLQPREHEDHLFQEVQKHEKSMWKHLEEDERTEVTNKLF